MGYLDNTGLSYFWNKIKSLVTKQSAKIPFGELDSTSTSTVMTATVPGITELVDGVACYIKNGVVGSASGYTLNVNNLGAKPVHSSFTGAATSTAFTSDTTYLFVYNSSRISGGCWDMYIGYYSDKNDTANQIHTDQANLVVYSTLYRYMICFTRLDGKILPANGVSNDTGTSKTLTTESFDPFGKIYYYGSTTTINAGVSPAPSYMWYMGHLDLRQSFNIGTTLTSKKPVYIKCIMQSDGSAKLSGNDCIVQSLPNTDDGYIYIQLGDAYSTYRITIDYCHPVYIYKNGGIRQIAGYAEYAANAATVGNLSNLTTTDKTSIVAAINELNARSITVVQDANTGSLTIT